MARLNVTVAAVCALALAPCLGGCAGAIIGGIAGGLLMQRINERALRIVIILIGIALTVGLFMRA